MAAYIVDANTDIVRRLFLVYAVHTCCPTLRLTLILEQRNLYGYIIFYNFSFVTIGRRLTALKFATLVFMRQKKKKKQGIT